MALPPLFDLLAKVDFKRQRDRRLQPREVEVKIATSLIFLISLNCNTTCARNPERKSRRDLPRFSFLGRFSACRCQSVLEFGGHQTIINEQLSM